MNETKDILKQAIFNISRLDERSDELVDRLWDLINEIEKEDA